MQAGWLRHRVTVQEKDVARDEYGDEIVAWSDVVTAWAAVEPLRGRELVEMRQEYAEVSTRIRLRFLRGVDTSMRVVWVDEVAAEHVFNIEAVIHPLERKRETHLMCVELVTP